MSSQPEITLYDKYDYDYATYWENRDYEHASEVFALENSLRDKSGSWFVDLGGSYGRHLPLYHQKFHNCILLDYSMKSLSKALSYLKRNNIRNVHLVAANIYNLPIKSSSIDGGMMVRVIHHLEKPDGAISEVSRVLKPNGFFILEFPNKHHIKAVMRALFKLDLSFIFSQEPAKVSVLNPTPEGTQKNERGIMYNYTLKFCRQLLVSHDIRPMKNQALSFFRIPILKKICPKKLMIILDKVSQKLIGWSHITPSILLEGISLPAQQRNSITAQSIDDLLACPKCKGPLHFQNTQFWCRSCKHGYKKTGGIYDLRYPLINT